MTVQLRSPSYDCPATITQLQTHSYNHSTTQLQPPSCDFGTRHYTLVYQARPCLNHHQNGEGPVWYSLDPLPGSMYFFQSSLGAGWSTLSGFPDRLSNSISHCRATSVTCTWPLCHRTTRRCVVCEYDRQYGVWCEYDRQ